MLRYHQRTIAYLQIPVEINEDRKQLLDKTEEEFDIVIPPSVREWYELKLPDRYEWTAETTYFGETSELIEHDYTIENGYLAIDWEYEQEEFYKFVKIDGTDDPLIVGVGFSKNRIPEHYSGPKYSEYIFSRFWASVVTGRVKYQINVALENPISQGFRQKIEDKEWKPIEFESDDVLRFQKNNIHIKVNEKSRYTPYDSDVNEIRYYTDYTIYVPSVESGYEMLTLFWDDLKDGILDTFPDFYNDIQGYIHWLLGRYPFQLTMNIPNQTDKQIENAVSVLENHVGEVRKLQFWYMFGNYDTPKTTKIVGTFESNQTLIEQSIDASSSFFAILQEDNTLHWRLMTKTEADMDVLVGILKKCYMGTVQYLFVESIAPNYNEMTSLLTMLKAKYD